MPVLAVAQLLELAAACGNEPAFALKMAKSRRLSNLAHLGLLMRDEPTLRRALEEVMRNIHLQNEALVIRMKRVGNLVSLPVVMPCMLRLRHETQSWKCRNPFRALRP